MDPFLVFLISICLILLASIIVNFYFVYLHMEFTISNSLTAIQTDQTYMADAEVQMTNCFEDHHHEQSTQTILKVQTVAMGTDYTVCRDSTVQAAELNYVDILKQLEELSKHSYVTLQDLNHCIGWISECEKGIVGNTQAAINMTQ